MRMKLACFILRQFMAAGHLSIAVADGPMHHIRARRTGPQVAIRLARRGVLWRLVNAIWMVICKSNPVLLMI